MLFRNYEKSNNDGVNWTGNILELDLSEVRPSVSGPKRPHDHIHLKNLQKDFTKCLNNEKNDFKGFGIESKNKEKTAKFNFQGKDYDLHHGDVVISAITSCTNTSNPGVMIAAGLIARKAAQLGLGVKPYIKTSLSPGSKVVEKYLKHSGLLKDLEKVGYNIVGYGCMTCIGNSGDLPPSLSEAIEKNDIVASSVLSGNRNFEGRVHPLTKANYLASPPLCVLYALAGTVNLDLDHDAIGTDKDGNKVFMKDLWPSNEEV